jgi:hypothetical protein
MPSLQVPFPDSSMPGTHSQESGGRIINAYVEPLGAGAPSPIIYRRAPGMRNWATTTRVGFRGALEVNGTLYSAWTNRIVKSGSIGGPAIDLGNMTGTAKGFWARNTNGLAVAGDPAPGVVFCDADGNYASIDTAANTVTTNFLSGSMPAPNSVCVIDNFFMWTIANGQVFASNFNSVNVGTLSVATAESKADGLIRGVPWIGQLFLFGPTTTEVWSNAGTTPFPFQRAVVIPRGIAGPFCVSGFEDNFSRALVWVADDNTVVRLNGYSPEKISPPDLDGLIEQVTDKRQLEMSCFISRGHAFILLSATAGPTWHEWSWVFDLNTDKWAERQSYQRLRTRITGGLYSFGKWLCGDTVATSQIQEITDQVTTEPPRPQAVLGAVAGSGTPPCVRLAVADASQLGTRVSVTGVVGTTEANSIWVTSVMDPTHIELVGSVFTNAYVSGGIVADAADLPLRWRLESGAVENFPVGARVGRFDAEFVTGVGIVQGTRTVAVSGAVVGTGGKVRLTVTSTANLADGNAVTVSGVGGVTEANGTWPVDVIDGTHLELNGSAFVVGPPPHVYTSGGVLTMLTPIDPIETDPVVEISWSDDGGNTYYAPIQRKLGRQAMTRQLVSLISCTGRSSWNARRWRLDVADPVYVGFMGAYQNVSPKVSDIG